MFARFFDDPLHLIVLLVVILIVFGAGKLPGVGAALGQSVREFKKATVEDDNQSAAAKASVPSTCAKCSTAIPAGAQFCPACGSPVQTQIPAEAVSSAATASCPSCGAKNVAGARFCAQCGSNMGVQVS
jgi:sec-independent protein translocase protein TatA